jgi:CheY-like chemotaxis protein
MILVVDDDELLAKMVAELLREEGYEVWTAGNGLDGYASYYQHQVETVVTDIDMPELDGFEMVRCIRAINPAVGTIYTSGAPEHYHGTLVTEAQKFGATVPRKPFALIDLVKLIPPSIREKAKQELASDDSSTDREKRCVETGRLIRRRSYGTVNENPFIKTTK